MMYMYCKTSLWKFEFLILFFVILVSPVLKSSFRMFYAHHHKLVNRYGIYGCLRWPRICSVCRRHTDTITFVFPRSKPKMTYYWIFYMSNTTGANSRTGIAYLCRVTGFVLVYCGILVVESLYFCFLCSVDYCLLFCPDDQWISCPLLISASEYPLW